MSPAIVKFKNLKFYIYPDDHGNPHVHIVGPECEAKIYIETLEIERAYGLKPKALNQILKQVALMKDDLLEAWEEYHGEE